MKRFRVPSPSLLAILVLPLLACGFACRSDTGFVLHQVTLGGPLALEPEVSGDRVAWSVFDGPVAGDFTDTEICTWTPTDGTLRLTDNELDEGEVQVSGDRVVWQCNMFDYNRNGERVAENYDFEIFTWTPDSGVVRLTANDTWDHLPQVSGDRVVWRGVSESVRGRDPEIFTWTPSEGVVQLSENDDEDTFPEVSGDRVVWRGTGGADEGADYEIFTWTPSEGVVQLTEDENDDMYPRVDGNRAVWECEGAILAWTPTEGAVRLSGDGRRASCPQIAGGRIVWMATGDGDGGNDSDIFTWTPCEGVVQLTENDVHDGWPEVSGDRIVWRVDGEHEGTSKVFIWADGAVAQIADCLVEGLRVSDRLVVWAGEGQNGREIFVAELDGSQANKRVQPTSGVAYRMEYHGQRARLTR